MKIKKVLITFPVAQSHREKIEAAAPDAEYLYFAGFHPYDEAADPTPEQMEEAEVILGSVKPSLLSHCKKLKFIQLHSAGVNLYMDIKLPEGTVMANAAGAYSLAMSECMLTGMMMLQKKMLQYMDNQKNHLWKCAGMTKSVSGSTILCVGAGDIGGEFLRRCKALGAYTIGVRRVCDNKPDFMDELHMVEKLDELLPKADVVALVLPQTPKTYHLFDERRLNLLRSDAIFINVGRGTTVDNMALCRMLEEGRLGGAVLDVFEKEPLPEDHPLWDAPDTIITPHETGGFMLQQTLDKLTEIIGDNYRRFCEGKSLINLVDFNEGYAKKNN
ncbi:MAG: D-2-hydroxyacid dehydrogenase [Firmicutes bacterium]|nr:D-2-hydroxyacid dehydrogenase [Bacillota bacterium]